MTLMQLPVIMLRALILTVMIECAAAWCLGVRDRNGQITVILANMMTNPLVVSCSAAAVVWIGYSALFPVTVILEILAVMAEGAVYKYKGTGNCDPFLMSLICNALSYVIGEILNRFVF